MAGIEHVTRLSGTVQAVQTLIGVTGNYEQLRNKPSINGVELLGDVSLEELGIYVTDSSGSGGLSSKARSLLIEILKSAVYTSDQSANITALEAALASGASDEEDTESDGDTSETVMYTVTNQLTNVTTSSKVTSVAANGGYSALLITMPGYVLGSVRVLMGGTDITTSAYSDGIVTIGAVTGNVVIVAVATVEDTGEETVIYSVTNDLTNVTTSNAVTSVEENGAYTATLTAAEGYELSSVTVTMGGADVTATVYSGGVVTIGAVTGDVVITATAAAVSAGIVNLFDKDTMVTEGFFIGTGGTAVAADSGKYATIPITGGKSYAMQRKTLSFANGSAGNITLLDAQENVVYKFVPNVSNKSGEYYCYCVEDDTVHLTLDSNPVGLVYKTDTNRKGVTFTTDATCAYLRLTVAYNGADCVESFMVEEGDTCHDYVAFGA